MNIHQELSREQLLVRISKIFILLVLVVFVLTRHVNASLWMLPEYKLAKIWSFTSDYHKVKPVKDAICVGAAGGIPIWRMPFFTLYSHNAKAEEPVLGISLTHHREVSWNDEYAHFWDSKEPNHHSVAFDAKASSFAEFASSATITGFIMGSGANSYLGMIQANAGFVNVTSVTWNGSSTGIVTRQVEGPRFSYYDLVAPTSGTHDITFTYDASGIMDIGAESFIGVNQGTPTGTLPTITSGDSTVPTITTTSATGGAIVNFVKRDGAPCTTETVDAAWTSDYNFRNTGNDVGLVGAHIAGAASVTQTDSLDMVCHWEIISIPLNASGVGGSSNNGLLSQQVVQ